MPTLMSYTLVIVEGRLESGVFNLVEILMIAKSMR
jgi:hypothetical protein